MMLSLDANVSYHRACVRLAHTETATRDEIIARARLDYTGDDLGVSVIRADDMSGPMLYEVATVIFWLD
jgi:hypothetical protein